MRRIWICLLTMFAVACAEIDAPCEVKVNLDPETTPAILPAITAGAQKIDQRTSTFYQVLGAAPDSIAIVRVRRTTKKSDITVKLRGIHDLPASAASTTLSRDDVDLEWDAKLDDTTKGKLSADIKIEYADVTFPTDGATIREMLTPEQRELLAIGAQRPFAALSLSECPGVTADLYKDLTPPPSGCDEATFEVWPFADGTAYELSCNTETLDAARDGLRAVMADVGAVAGADQRGKTERSLALCL